MPASSSRVSVASTIARATSRSSRVWVIVVPYRPGEGWQARLGLAVDNPRAGILGRGRPPGPALADGYDHAPRQRCRTHRRMVSLSAMSGELLFTVSELVPRRHRPEPGQARRPTP